MSPALLLDEMLSPQIAVGLREGGHDVLAVVAEHGLRSYSDADLLVHATGQSRCLVTCNVRDFLAIARAWVGLGQAHAGIVWVPSCAFPQNRSFIGRMVEALDALLVSGKVPGYDGIWFLSPPGARSSGP